MSKRERKLNPRSRFLSVEEHWELIRDRDYDLNDLEADLAEEKLEQIEIRLMEKKTQLK